MFSKEMRDVIATLVVDHGIEVERQVWKDEAPFFDLASRAKSHMHLLEDGNEFVLRMRYDREFRIPLDTEPDGVVMWLAEHFAYDALHGRGFGSERWDAVCRKHNIEPDYGSM